MFFWQADSASETKWMAAAQNAILPTVTVFCRTPRRLDLFHIPHLEGKLPPIHMVYPTRISPRVHPDANPTPLGLLLRPPLRQLQVRADFEMVLTVSAPGDVPAAQHGFGADGVLDTRLGGVRKPRGDEE